MPSHYTAVEEAARKPLQAEVDRLRAEIERLRAENQVLHGLITNNVALIERYNAAMDRSIRTTQGRSETQRQIGPAAIKAVVDEQANDEGLWVVPETITEDYLQRALRRLHEAIEGKSSEQCAIETLEQYRKKAPS